MSIRTDVVISERLEVSADAEVRWRQILVEGHRPLRLAHLPFRHPRSPPCSKLCHNPFDGIGGRLVGLVGSTRSLKNPTPCARCCTRCGQSTSPCCLPTYAARPRWRNSSDRAFAAQINSLYAPATEVLVHTTRSSTSSSPMSDARCSFAASAGRITADGSRARADGCDRKRNVRRVDRHRRRSASASDYCRRQSA